MTNEKIERALADAKKGMADVGNKIAHAEADITADLEKVKARFGHDDGLVKKAAYAKSDIKAGAKKAKADVENKLAHAKADTDEAKADIGKKMDDALK
jgi:hypothetical protein